MLGLTETQISLSLLAHVVLSDGMLWDCVVHRYVFILKVSYCLKLNVRDLLVVNLGGVVVWNVSR